MPPDPNYERVTTAPLKKVRLNREYACVRQLISVLTNDSSDKLIVEKLKGKDLSELLCSAKIMGKSKDMATNKRILDCVIRAIEREKHFMRRKEIETSWSRRFFSSFNCLYPIRSDVTVLGENGANRSKRRIQGSGKSVSARGGKKSVKNGGKTRTKRNASIVYAAQLRREGMVNFRNILRQTSRTGRTCLHIFKKELPSYETVFPPNLSCVQVLHLELVPAPVCREPDSLFLNRSTSSTQTWDVDSLYPLSKTCDPSVTDKLQHLLDVANYQSDDQSRWMKNFIRYDDFSMTTDTSPYLKYPLKSTKLMNNPDSIQDRTRSDLSLGSEGSGYELIGLGERESKESCLSKDAEKARQINENQLKQKLCKKEQDLVYETSKTQPEDHRKIGACIMKRINASIMGCNSDKSCPLTNPIVPELVLKCTELFENETEDEEFNDSGDGSSCITSLEVSSMNRESNLSQRSILKNNYCFSTKKNSVSSNTGLLGVSEDSLNSVMLFRRDSSNGLKHPNSKKLDRHVVSPETFAENATQTAGMSIHSFLEGLRDKLSHSVQNSGKIIVQKDQAHSSIEISRKRECFDLKAKNLEIQKTMVGLSAEIWTNQLSNEGDGPMKPSAIESLGPSEFGNELNSIQEEFQPEEKRNNTENGLVDSKSSQNITLKNEIIFENHVPTSTTSFSFTEGPNDHHRAAVEKKGKRKNGKRSKKNGLDGTKSCKVM